MMLVLDQFSLLMLHSIIVSIFFQELQQFLQTYFHYKNRLKLKIT
jgi:hypothetical protein